MADRCRERVLQGIAVSGGLAVGPALFVGGEGPVRRASGAPEDEAAALERALGEARASLAALIAASDTLAAEILEFQLALAEDEDLIRPILARVEAGEPADAAWRTALDAEIAEYAAADDAYMAARASDLVDLRDRVLRALSGANGVRPLEADGAILVAEDLTPSAFLERDWTRLAGAALFGGSATSHVAILARARGVPMVVGLFGNAAEIAAARTVALDPGRGRLIVEPSRATLDELSRRAVAARVEGVRADAAARRPAVTRSGRAVRVLINVDDPAILDRLSPEICDGIGLTRTEFLFQRGTQPDEEAQLAVYRRILAWAAGRPVTIRTLDAGGDKPIPGVTIDGETNPFLGVRGVRLSLARPALFRVQLRALARAAADGPLKVMLPMVTVAAEIAAARALLDEAILDLAAARLPHARPALGAMIETPAAALTAAELGAEFFSIGSNDLVQYVMAAARDNPALAHLADPLNPAVLELIGRTVEAGRACGVEVSLCGDMASSPALVASLLATGLDTLSVAPAQIGRVKLAIGEAA